LANEISAVMLDTLGANQMDFADDHVMEKYQYIKLIKGNLLSKIHVLTSI